MALHLPSNGLRPFDGLVRPEGVEPPTHSFEGCCSIQLSYGRMSLGEYTVF